MGLCDAYYLHSEYSNTITFATKDLGNLLKQYPWNRIFNLKWASRAGLKGIVKLMMIKLNLVLIFKIFKNKLKNLGGVKRSVDFELDYTYAEMAGVMPC